MAISLLVILTGQGVAASRGMDGPVGQMVLCTSTGPVVVYMDASGQPTRPAHFCPDYALALLGAIDVPALDLPLASKVTQPAPLRKADNLIALPVPRKPARAPPIFL
ncbi:hypothetical protein [Ruegeria profundi]|uniref:hypothetical protein n=1 Tax=Ruegeria profundi TaxID=1685378 RepID=UPI001F3DAEAF|nr:hypothetical protein [Ruegeria profundi]